MENEEVSLLNDIEKRVLKLRDPKEDSRYGTCYELLYYLNYTERLSMSKYDAFLIKAVNQAFGEFTPDADIVLMALGLLDGYDYRIILKHTDRRIKFLEESPYLGSKKHSYGEVDEGRRESYEKTIREKSENPKLHLLAEYLESIQDQVDNFLVDINNYIDGKTAILPTPSYIKRKPLRDRIKKAVITFFLAGRKICTTTSDIVIDKNNECRIDVDLPKDAITAMLNIAFIMLLCISLPITTTIYTQKYTLGKSQELNKEYQTEDDIASVLERTEQKLEAKPYTLDLSSENGNTVSPF